MALLFFWLFLWLGVRLHVLINRLVNEIAGDVAESARRQLVKQVLRDLKRNVMLHLILVVSIVNCDPDVDFHDSPCVRSIVLRFYVLPSGLTVGDDHAIYPALRYTVAN